VLPSICKTDAQINWYDEISLSIGSTIAQHIVDECARLGPILPRKGLRSTFLCGQVIHAPKAYLQDFPNTFQFSAAAIPQWKIMQ
jgi:hypothetical protein